MATTIIALSQNIEEEGFNVVVERLVVEEQLGKKTEILTIYLVLLPVDLEHREIGIAIYFIPRRMSQSALQLMPKQSFLFLHVLEAKLAEEQLGAL